MLAAIRKTQDGYEATFERILPHPPEKVWAAISDGKEISRWFTRSELEARPGGRYVVHHDHVGITSEEEVLRLEAPRVFEHTWGKAEAAGRPADTVRWEVHPHAEGSRLVLAYRFRDLERAPGTLSGWHIWLDVLAAVHRGERRADHEPPHGTVREGAFRPTAPGRGLWTRHAEVLAAYERRVKEKPGVVSGSG